MAKFQIAKTLIAKYFRQENWHSQQPSDWTGPFPLPLTIVDYYAILGPIDVTIRGYGNPYFLPRLGQLWDYQAGYRWNAHTGDLLEDWDDDWIVIADEGADPFILSRTTGHVFFDHHGEGKWQPFLLFDNLEEMASCLLILGGLLSNKHSDDYADADSFIKQQYYSDALQQLSEVVFSEDKAHAVLSKLGWVTSSMFFGDSNI